MRQRLAALSSRMAPTMGRAARGPIGRAFVAGGTSKIITVVTQVLVWAVCARQLSSDEFGIIALFLGSLGILGFLGLGIGNSLITSLSGASRLGQDEAARREIGRAFSALLLLGSAAGLVGVIAALSVPSNYLPSAGQVPHGVVAANFAIFAASIAMSVPGSLGTHLSLPLEKGTSNSLVLAVSSALSLAAVSVGMLWDVPLAYYTLATITVPTIVGFVQTGWFMGRRGYAIRWEHLSLDGFSDVVRQGLPFLVFNVGMVGAYRSQPLLVAYVLGTSSAAAFGVANRMFNIVSTLYAGGLQQMWAVLARHRSAGDIEQMRATVRRVLAFTVGTALPVSVALLWAGPALARIWVGAENVPPASLFLAFALWSPYRLAMSVLSFLLNAADVVWVQALANVLLATLAVPLGIALTLAIGMSGVIVAVFVGHVLIVTPVLVRNARRILREG